jgi:hypothetical protein
MRRSSLDSFAEPALAAALFLVAVLSFTVTFYSMSQPFEESYWQTFVGARFRKELGFSTGLIPVADHYDARLGQLRIFGITQVAPGGSFEKAGLRAGDLPAAFAVPGYDHGCTKGGEWGRELCRIYIGGPCRITGFASAVRQEQVGVMFYSALSEARRSGRLRLSVISIADLNHDDWQNRARLVDVQVR